jgi:hypothetical protein
MTIGGIRADREPRRPLCGRSTPRAEVLSAVESDQTITITIAAHDLELVSLRVEPGTPYEHRAGRFAGPGLLTLAVSEGRYGFRTSS